MAGTFRAWCAKRIEPGLLALGASGIAQPFFL